MSPAGRLEAIWLKRVRRGPMDPVDRARAKAGSGLVGNADQGGRRQVTLINVESWAQAAAEVEGEPDPVLRRANLLVSGIDLEQSRGKRLRIGGIEIGIYGETRPCRLMEEIYPGLQAALDPDWRAGAFGEVLTDGEIELGDEVAWIEN